jgi:hypothetical protein
MSHDLPPAKPLQPPYVIICDVQAQKHSFYICIEAWHIRLADERPDSTPTYAQLTGLSGEVT